ncbi:MAG: restriction endonuclease [Methyloceanibacter sp.]
MRVGLADVAGTGHGGTGHYSVTGFPTAAPQAPVLVVESIIIPGPQTAEGVLITANTVALYDMIRRLGANWQSAAYELTWRQWEELLAGVYQDAGYEVTLTRPSGDHGCDVIAQRNGFDCLKVRIQMKRYKPDLVVTAEQARALLGTLYGDPAASKAVLATTSRFAPRILQDPAVGPAVPTRLQLWDGEDLQELFKRVERGEAKL